VTDRPQTPREAPEEPARMTDEQRPGDDQPTGATPWWSGSSGDVWSGSPQTREGSATGWPDTEVIERAGEPAGEPAADPWALTDTLGEEPRPPRQQRTGVLVALGVVVALLAGTLGGAVGFLLAERDSGGLTVDGASLGSAPARSVERPAGSVAGVAAAVLPSVVQIKVETSDGGATGSGFVVDDEGLVVTNNHVVDGARGRVALSFSDGTDVTAEIVGTSASYDLAVLRVDARNLPALPLGNSDSVVVGDPVIAIGSPLGLSGTVTSGIISAKDRPVTAGSRDSNDESAYINALQTDAAINPGNSGGPLVNLDGEVIGVNSAIATVGGAFGGESGNIGVGFAIPINQVRRTVEQIIETGEAQFPIIGASLDGRYDGEGARIASAESGNGTPPIVPDGPADQAGLQAGDVILEIDGNPVEGSSELIVAIRSRSPGDTVRLTVRRDGSEQVVDVTLGATEG
jgi:putative serine protease PepD